MNDHDALPSVAELLETAVTAMGGQQRSGQQQMAAAVDHAMATGQHLAVQAGTGTGKSLAYLVPALRHAVESGRTVVVSTATIALQRQLCHRDLPLLCDALANSLGRRPTFTLLKGRNNYLCLNALDAAEDPDLAEDGTAALIPSQAGTHALRIREWAMETETGDRDDLKPGVPDLVWRAVSVDTQSCIGAQTCPYGEECFPEEARRQARRADIVVTNHSMLAIDAASPIELLPDHDVVIVDEAHELERRVTTVVSGALSTGGLEQLRKRLNHLVTDQEADTFQESVERLTVVLENSRSGRWEELTAQQLETLLLLRSTANALLTSLGPVKEADIASDPKAATVKKQAVGALTQIVEVCDVATAQSPHYVVWMTEEGRRGTELHVAPLSVAPILREHLFGKSTVVLTSATLEAGGSFATMARQWGLPDQEREAQPLPDMATSLDPNRAGIESEHTHEEHQTEPSTERSLLSWLSLDVGSPFDHKTAGILYIARDLPQPGNDGTAARTLERIEELISAAGGRALVLCSSRRAAEAIAEYLEEHIPYPVLCQGQDTTSTLISEFAAHEESCLVGTISLWQGVDVPGPACSLVIIDRIPFPRPDDPLMSARLNYVNKHGGNGFMSVAAAHAALLLAQGTGRLLRSTTDRGVIAVMDPRLTTARYGGFLRRSLPPYWETTDTEVVLAALKRLTAG